MKYHVCTALVFAIACFAGPSAAKAGVLVASGLSGGHYYELYAYGQAGGDKSWATANATANGVRLDVEFLVTHEFDDLEKIHEAMTLLDNRSAMKVVFHPGG